MSEKRKYNRIFRPGRCLRTLLVLFTALTMAAGLLLCPADTARADSSDGKCSVTITFPLEGIQTYLYRVGDVVSTGEYQLTEKFDSYSVDLEEKTAAEDLAKYARRDSLEADATAPTGEDGKVSFNNLDQGVYLILSDSVDTDDGMIVTSAVMLELPQWDDDNILQWDIEMDAKYEIQPHEKTSLKVKKVWKNDTASDRPESVTVQLLKDGQVYEEDILNADNKWTKNWPELDATHVWTVVEKEVPEGYKVSTVVSGSNVTITNKGSNPDTPSTPSTPTTPSTSSGKLPKTGQVWWPMPYLVAGGVILLILGAILRRRAG